MKYLFYIGALVFVVAAVVVLMLPGEAPQCSKSVDCVVKP